MSLRRSSRCARRCARVSRGMPRCSRRSAARKSMTRRRAPRSLPMCCSRKRRLRDWSTADSRGASSSLTLSVVSIAARPARGARHRASAIVALLDEAPLVLDGPSSRRSASCREARRDASRMAASRASICAFAPPPKRSDDARNSSIGAFDMSAQKGKDLLLKIDDGTRDFRHRRGSAHAAPVAQRRHRRCDRRGIGGTLARAARRRRREAREPRGNRHFQGSASDALIRQLFFDGALRSWQIVVPDFGDRGGIVPDHEPRLSRRAQRRE